MLYTEYFTMRHYVGFSLIGSHTYIYIYIYIYIYHMFITFISIIVHILLFMRLFCAESYYYDDTELTTFTYWC